MQLDAALESTMTERFNVAGAMLAKLFGRPGRSPACSPSGRPRSGTSAWSRRCTAAAVHHATLLASLSTAVVYGVGGDLVVRGAFQVGTLVSMALLLQRWYGPITALSTFRSMR